MKINLKKLALICIGLLPNSFVIRSGLYFFPNITILIYVIIYGIFLISILKNYNLIKIKLSKFDFFFFLWGFFLLFSLLYTPNIQEGILRVGTFFLLNLSVIYFLKYFLTTKSDWNFFLKFFLITSFLTQIYVLSEFMRQGMPLGRFSFFNANPIPLGLLGAISAIILLSLVIEKKIPIFQFIVAFSSSIGTLLISSSNGPLLATIVGLIALIPSFASISKISKRTIAILIFLIIGFLFISQSPQFHAFETRAMNVTDSMSTQARLEVFEIAINTFRKYPFLGGGVGYFTTHYPHNVFLEVLAEGGIILGAIFILFFLWIIKRYLEYIKYFQDISEFYIPLIITIMSLTVLMVSFTYINFRLIFLGIGLMIILNKQFIDQNVT